MMGNELDLACRKNKYLKFFIVISIFTALTNCYEIKYLISIFVRTELALLLRRSSSCSHLARLDFFLTFFVKKVSSENRISATKYCKVNYFVLNFNLSPTLKKVLFLECELAYICQMACNKHFWT